MKPLQRAKLQCPAANDARNYQAQARAAVAHSANQVHSSCSATPPCSAPVRPSCSGTR
eukprot:CAMPEP_0197665962 /NCGR_PEP_ID=MMETSP1338-20131121/61034_1 /TAXON_ID=43686 ORGANISM="Pelagodinium beii, Strain RCC1491" /NCGR_SAMPLE_ID=MMETSP1338 /ASSEMBLY_ACC=CAM_ASM_000754 /LENGTH=57 /DNA_ID=CAMNT_0043244903 /DNA_START=96 /DNA_END=265 /DNA_ORIENTATION=+